MNHTCIWYVEDHVTTFLSYVDIADIHPRARIKYQDAFLPGNMQIHPSTVLLLSEKIRMFGVGFFLKERGLCFQSHIAWALLQLNWSVNLWKKLRNHTVQSSVNHCDSFTSEACIITAKACSAAWFNSHAIIGASELDGGRVFLSKHCHLTCCVSDHTGPDIIDSSLLEEYL